MNDNSLTSLLYFLGFGLFFYWMMRKGGCGMHGHGDHSGHRHGEDAPSNTDKPGSGSPKDPVCGMPVDLERAAGMRQVKGQNFYFCSANCLAKFDADPEGFAGRASPEKASPHGHHQHHGC